MKIKDVVMVFAPIFAGILLLAILLMIWEGGMKMNGMLFGICMLAGGGIILPFELLIIERIKKYH